MNDKEKLIEIRDGINQHLAASTPPADPPDQPPPPTPVVYPDITFPKNADFDSDKIDDWDRRQLWLAAGRPEWEKYKAGYKGLLSFLEGGGLFADGLAGAHFEKILGKRIYAVRLENSRASFGDIRIEEGKIGLHIGENCQVTGGRVSGYGIHDKWAGMEGRSADLIILNGKSSKFDLEEAVGDDLTDCVIDCKGTGTVKHVVEGPKGSGLSSAKSWGHLVVSGSVELRPRAVALQAWAGASQPAYLYCNGGAIFWRPEFPTGIIKANGNPYGGGVFPSTVEIGGKLKIIGLPSDYNMDRLFSVAFGGKILGISNVVRG